MEGFQERRVLGKKGFGKEGIYEGTDLEKKEFREKGF